MSELGRDTVIRFLCGRGGRVPNQQLVEHFRPLLTEQPPGEARNAARQLFKDIVNEVASVRAEDGVKYVCLRKRYRRAAEEAKEGPERGTETKPADGKATTPDPSIREEITANNTGEEITAKPSTVGEITIKPSSTGEEIIAIKPSSTREEITIKPSSTREEIPADISPEVEITAKPKTGEIITSKPSTGEEITIKPSSTREEITIKPSSTREEITIKPSSTREEIPADMSPGEEMTAKPSSPEEEERSSDSSPGEESPQAAASPDYDGPPKISVTEDEPGEKMRRKPPSRSPGRTPRNSRRGAAREPVSPQLRRGAGGILLRAGLRDSDSSSLHSSSSVSGNEEEEGGGGSVSLEPLEHAWMLSSCRARWDSLRELLLAEPGLITRRDFITGFSCLHWAAKHGQHELLVTLLSHARQHRVPVNINARASGGYTPLHLAAMHGHLDVMKLLVGAYDADLDIRDYSGRKAWQYLSQDTARDVQALVGALPGPEDDGTNSGSGRWRLSKVLPTQLILHRLSQLPEDEQDGGGRTRADISRKGSGGSRGKPRLNRIRFRTQIIHTNLSARDHDEDEDRTLKSPMRHRPKSNVFG